MTAMTALALQWLVLARLGILVGFAFCYSLGGLGIWGGKLWRRVIGSGVLAVGTTLLSVWTHTFCWWFLLSWPAYGLATSLGYGVNQDDPWHKVLRRAWYGLWLGLCALCFVHSWATLAIGMCQIVLAVSGSVVLGVNGWLDAREEEAVIGLLSACLVPFMP